MSIRVFSLGALLALSAAAAAQTAPFRVSEQRLYLPVYSHIWHGDLGADGQPVKTLVSVLVSIRNTNPTRPIQLLTARYVDTAGKSLKDYLAAPVMIGPLAAYELFVPRADDTGGSGAAFLLSWSADRPVNPPVVEAIHANLPAGRAIAFKTTAQPVLAD